ncbi:MAG: hypothetical protein AAF927_05645 [Bacteroidota bacterium]
MKMHLILIVGLILPFWLSAQDTPPVEGISVVFDKAFYVAGENAWFAVDINQADLKEKSGVLHCELLNREGEVLVYQQLKIEAGRTQGDFYIPPAWKEDYYTFRAYTLWNLNFIPQQIFHRAIPIYNLDEGTLAETEPANGEPEASQKLGNWQINIQPTAQSYARNDSVELNIQILDAAGNPIKQGVNLSVTQNDLLPNQLTDKMNTMPPAGEGLKFVKRYDCEQSLSLRAEVYDVLFQRPMNADFLAVYLVETQEFQFTNAKNGKVETVLPNFYGTGTLQLYDRGAQENYVPRIRQIFPRELISKAPDFPDAFPPRTPAIKQYMSAMSSRRDFAQLFGQSIPIPVPDRTPEVDNLTPDRSFVLKDYIPFKDMESFIIEAMTTVKIEPILAQSTIDQIEAFQKEVSPEMLRSLDRQEDIEASQVFLNKILPAYRSRLENQKTLSLLEEESRQRFLGPPMFLIDNYITFDPQKIFEVPWKEVERLELYTLNRTLGNTFGPLGFNGVFAVYTRRLEAPKTILEDPHNLPYQGLYRARSFEESLGEEQQESPDFRPLVYWHGNLMPDQNGQIKLRFKHTDDLGNFRVRVQGIESQDSWGLQDAIYTVSFDGS